VVRTKFSVSRKYTYQINVLVYYSLRCLTVAVFVFYCYPNRQAKMRLRFLEFLVDTKHSANIFRMFAESIKDC